MLLTIRDLQVKLPLNVNLNVQVSSTVYEYDSVYLTCSKKLTGSQLSPTHGTNKKLKCETKTKTMSMIGPVVMSSRYREAVR